MSFEEGLKKFAKDLGSKIDKSIRELLYGHYPDLTEKEFAICKNIASVWWEGGHLGDYDILVDILAREYKELFHNTDEVETVIKQLIEKGIIRDQFIFKKCYFPPNMRCKECLFSPWARNCEGYLMLPMRLLYLKDEIESEASMIYRNHFKSSSTEYFGPVRSEDPS
jgi:hypothetical protein